MSLEEQQQLIGEMVLDYVDSNREMVVIRVQLSDIRQRFGSAARALNDLIEPIDKARPLELENFPTPERTLSLVAALCTQRERNARLVEALRAIGVKVYSNSDTAS